MARLHTLRAGRVLAMAAIATAVALVASCISAQERDYVKYDAGKDEFHMLMVLTDIKATDQDDLDYLAAHGQVAVKGGLFGRRYVRR